MSLKFKVIQIKDKNTGQPLYRVYDDTHRIHQPINSFLVYSELHFKAPNTVKSRASDLITFFQYLMSNRLDWRCLDNERWSGFIHLLKTCSSKTIVDINVQARSNSTINRYLHTVKSFYEFHNKQDLQVAPELNITSKSNHSWNGFLSFAAGGRSKAAQEGKKIEGIQRASSPTPKTLKPKQLEQMLDGCKNRRNLLLVSLLCETGMLIGQVLGLKHEDIESWNRKIVIRPRFNNPNGVFAKTKVEFEVHISDSWRQLYTDYLIYDLDEIESDFVFINIYHSDGPKDRPITYSNVRKIFNQLSKKIEIKVTPHMLRHTHATDLLRSGLSLELTAKRLGHQSLKLSYN